MAVPDRTAPPNSAPMAGDHPAGSNVQLAAEGVVADPVTRKKRPRGSATAETVIELSAPPTHTRRLVSLDVLRGLTIAFMIMVNNNGGPGSWAQMNHAEWNGFTATDLVFPTFLFVAGVSIVFAFDTRLARGAPRAQLVRHTIARAIILALLGIFLNGFPDFHLAHLRFYGVLQRIALCYLAVGLFYLFDRRVKSKLIALACALIGYWILLRWIPVPGAGMPGRDIAFLDPNQNIVAWVDRHLMPGHLYEEWPLHNMRDPEGLLSTIPAIATTLLGLLTGMWLRTQRALKAKTAGLVGGAIACLAAGYLWSAWFPLNKKMWTSSYVLVAAGWSLAIFALLYWAIEQKGWGREASGAAPQHSEGWSRKILWPWLVFGSNAIVAYLVSELLPGILFNIHFHWYGMRMTPLGWVHLRFFAHIPDLGWAAFAYSLSYTVACFIPVWLLYRNRVFVKI